VIDVLVFDRILDRVMMCFESRRLMSSMSAASVVVLPAPVAPPTMTRPRGMRAIASVPDGRSRLARSGTFAGSMRIAAAARPRS
jgi:hypothetical protein